MPGQESSGSAVAAEAPAAVVRHRLRPPASDEALPPLPDDKPAGSATGRGGRPGAGSGRRTGRQPGPGPAGRIGSLGPRRRRRYRGHGRTGRHRTRRPAAADERPIPVPQPDASAVGETNAAPAAHGPGGGRRPRPRPDPVAGLRGVELLPPAAGQSPLHAEAR